jgi:hypothetical protein
MPIRSLIFQVRFKDDSPSVPWEKRLRIPLFIQQEIKYKEVAEELNKILSTNGKLVEELRIESEMGNGNYFWFNEGV